MIQQIGPRRIQMHLSTALVLMFAAGGLIWANTHKHFYGDSEYYTQGFPFEFGYKSEFQQCLGYALGPFEPAVFIVDLIFAAGLLFELAWIIESLIRKARWYWILLVAGGGTTMLYFFAATLLSQLQPYIGRRYPK